MTGRRGGCEDPGHHYGDSKVVAIIRPDSAVPIPVCRQCFSGYPHDVPFRRVD